MNATASISSISRRKQVDFRALLEAITRRHEGNYFGPLGVLGAFEVYRWMVQSILDGDGYPYRWSTRWGSGSLIANLGDAISCTNMYSPRPFGKDWRNQLHRRFVHALLDKGPMADWRRRMRIDLDRPRSVPMLWQERSGLIERDLDRLFALVTPTRRLTVSLNTTHDDARFLTGIHLTVNARGWATRIEYGVDGSRWDEDYRKSVNERDDAEEDVVRTQQHEDETLLAFVGRVREKYDALLTPPCARRRWSCQPPDRPFASLPWPGIGVPCEDGPNG